MGGENAKKALHFVRGHWRRSSAERAKIVSGELRVWIAGHWRGNPAIGIKISGYKAGRDLADAIRRMNSNLVAVQPRHDRRGPARHVHTQGSGTVAVVR